MKRHNHQKKSIPSLSQLCQQFIRRDAHTHGVGAHTLVNKLYLGHAQPDFYFAAGEAPTLNRGRKRREAKHPINTNTLGICDEENTPPQLRNQFTHTAAKCLYSAIPESPFVKKIKENGGNFIGGPSGTLGRNLFMFYLLCDLNPSEQRMYLMILFADLILRGHHSPEEIQEAGRYFGFFSERDIARAANPKDYKKYCELFLTETFKKSPEYKQLSLT